MVKNLKSGGLSMSDKKLSSFSLFLMWSGGAISIAEILTGALLAPLKVSSGITAIIIGHLLGGALLYLAALMGSTMRKSAMESTRYSFGRYGSYLFSSFNIIQLLGWTSIMIIQGSRVFDQISLTMYNYSNPTLWIIIITVGISLWLILLSRHYSLINSVVVFLLLILCIVIAFRLSHRFTPSPVDSTVQTITFWQGVELNIAMCLSWLPLIGDYTQNSKRIHAGPFWSVIGYSIVGSGMFSLGFFLAKTTQNSDIATMLVLSGLTIGALFIVLFSTITTTFLDLYSAQDSFLNIFPTTHKRLLSFLLCIVSFLFALLLPMENIEPFLYFIGSIFSPLYAILFTEYFILKKKSDQEKRWNVSNLVLWAAGFCAYLLIQHSFSTFSNSIIIFLVVASARLIGSRLRGDRCDERC